MIRLYALFLVLLAGFTLPVQAQDLTLSPYSRYAIGEIFNTVTTRNAAMGGVGIATDNYFSINRNNPASYADLFFTTMDVSAFGQFSRFNSPDSQEDRFFGGMQSAAFAFPSNGNFTLAFGFAPYSAVGYNFLDLTPIPNDTLLQSASYSAEGGLNQAFVGGAFKLLKGKLRLGANLEYLFGNTRYRWENLVLNSDSSVSGAFNPIVVERDVFVNGFLGQAGLIFQDTLVSEKRILFRLGATAEYTLSLNGDRFTTFSNGIIADTLNTEQVGEVTIPPKFGLGFMVHRPGYWSLGAEATLQDWGQFQYFSDNQVLGRELRIAGGGEWTPNPESSSYFKRIELRAGGYWKQTYILFNDKPLTDMGFTLGFGLPAGLKGNSRLNQGRAASRINVSAELGRRGNLNSGQPLEELYARIRLGITVNDRWFIRRRAD
jgi:hypothetical protein